jgi:hypothetical protein
MARQTRRFTTVGVEGVGRHGVWRCDLSGLIPERLLGPTRAPKATEVELVSILLVLIAIPLTWVSADISRRTDMQALEAAGEVVLHSMEDRKEGATTTPPFSGASSISRQYLQAPEVFPTGWPAGSGRAV